MGKQRVLNYLIEASWKGSGNVKNAKTDMESLGPAGKKGVEGTKGLEGALGSLGKIAGGLVAAGVLAKLGSETLQFAEDSIQAASDVEESYAKFETVFKETAGGVEIELENIANATGRSRFELIDYAATLQDTFVPLGFARDAAAEMSTTLVQLAIDLASFNNLDTETVVQDLQSALVGNTETLRKYGVVAQETQIKQQALAMGLWDGTGALDAQTKAAAILEITLNSTTDAQGDAVRTVDSYANQVRAAEAAMYDLQVSFGQSISLFAEAKVETQLYITEALLPLIEAWAASSRGALEAADSVEVFLNSLGIVTIGDYAAQVKLIEKAIDGVAFSSPSAVLAIQKITDDALIPLLAQAGASADSVGELRQVYDDMGLTVTNRGVQIGEGLKTIFVSWEALREAIDEARLAEKFREIDESLGPVDAKLKNLGTLPSRRDRLEEIAAQAAAARAALVGLDRVEPFDTVSRPENLAHLIEFVRDILAGGGSAAETLARIRGEYMALIEAGRVTRGGFFTEFFDTSELDKQFGEFFQFTVDYSTRIKELETELGEFDPGEDGEFTKTQTKKIEELTAELDTLKAAHGQVATAFDSDEQFAGLVESILEVATAGGTAGEQILGLAGNTEAARKAMTDAHFEEFAQNLGTQMAAGTLTWQQALEDLQTFMENFDLDAALAREGIVGSGDTRALEIRQATMGIVEGLNTVVSEGAIKVEETAATAKTKVDELTEASAALEGPWPYEIQTESIENAIGRAIYLRDLMLQIEGVTLPGAGGPGGGPGIPAAVSDLPPGSNSPGGGGVAGVSNTPPGININVFGAPGMSPAAVANETLYQLNQFGWNLRGT